MARPGIKPSKPSRGSARARLSGLHAWFGLLGGVYLCVTPSNRIEWRVCLARLGGCACSVRLARWYDPIAWARLGSAEQPIGLLGLGLIPGLAMAETFFILKQCFMHIIH